MPALAMKIAVGVPVTFCRVCLLDRDRHVLTTLGVHALHPLGDVQPVAGEQWQLEKMPRLRAAVDNAEVTLLTAKDAATEPEKDEQKTLFPSDVQVVCCLPIVSTGMLLGAIIVGLTVAFPQGIGGLTGDFQAWWQARRAKPEDGPTPALEAEAAP